MYKQLVYTFILISFLFLIGCNNSSLESDNETIQPEYIRYNGEQQYVNQNRPPIPVQPGREQNIFEERSQNERSGQQDNFQEQKQESTFDGEKITEYKQHVVELTNEARSEHGAEPVKLDEELAEVAQRKSEDMEQKDYFSHTSPTYGSPSNMLNHYGIDYRKALENIAAGQQSPEEVVEGWLNSEGHRRNILDEEVTHIGVGFSSAGSYWTQLFIKK